MFLKCKCGRAIDLIEELDRNMATEKIRGKLYLRLTPGFTVIECKCKIEWILDVAYGDRKEVPITKGPFKGKTLQLPIKIKGPKK